MIRQALFIRHFFGSRLVSIDLTDLIERITASLGIDLLQIGKLSSGVCQATAFDALAVSAPIGRRRVTHPNHRAEIILTLFEQPLHVFSGVTATVEVERDYHAVFSLSHDPRRLNPDSL